MAFETVTAETVLGQFLTLSPDEQDWLREQLDRLDDLPQNGSHNKTKQEMTTIWDDDDDEPLPESATLDEAITLYLADKCSLGRAAELAGVTRWDIQDILYERGTPASLGSDMTLEEIDVMVDMIEDRYGSY